MSDDKIRKLAGIKDCGVSLPNKAPISILEVVDERGIVIDELRDGGTEKDVDMPYHIIQESMQK